MVMARQESAIMQDAAQLLTPIPLSEDVLTMARNARRDQGIHEQEVSFSGEAGLHDSLNSCEKNPGHRGFTPISELCAERLPECIRSPAVADFLVSKARETVRLSCAYTSPARPENYCFGSYRGRRDMTRYGSGRVWSVYAERVRYDIPCPFTDCTEQRGTGSPNDEAAKECIEQCGPGNCNDGLTKHCTEPRIVQSCHDELTKGQRENIEERPQPEGVNDFREGAKSNRVQGGEPCYDICREEDNVKDKSVNENTRSNQTKAESAKEGGKVGVKADNQHCHKKESRTGYQAHYEENCEDRSWDTFVVRDGRQDEKDNKDQKNPEENSVLTQNVPSKNTSEKVSECNISPICVEKRKMCNSCKSRMENMETTEVCKSNSVEETENFKAKNAKPRRSDEKDFHNVKSSQIQINVAQELVQNEDRDNDKTSSTLPEGERALNVETPTTSLDTDSENASSSPELAHLRAPPQHCVSGFFRIHTANHVVFDDAEARQTIVEFFYDDHRDVRHVIRARGVRVTRSDLDGDYCVLDCVTHDANLGPALDAVRREWSSLWNEVKDKLYGSDVSMVISHPHGCSKQFSVGRCLSREWGQAAGGQGWYRYTYDVPTCPGSSGAPVWVPGRDGLLSGYAPHSGSFNADVARSAVWFFWNMPQSK